MKKRTFLFSFLALFSLCGVHAQEQIPQEQLGQHVDEIIIVNTIGGGTFQGKLLKVDTDRIELLSTDGVILSLYLPEIQSIVKVEISGQENPYYQDAAANRLIIIPTGFGLDPGEFHIADQEIAAVTASYGVIPHFSLWAGVSVPGGVLNARFSMQPGDGVGLSAGSFAGILWLGNFTGALIPYGIASLGSENKNITFGVGGALSFGQNTAPLPGWYFKFSALIGVLGGKLPLSSTTALISENWVIWPFLGQGFDSNITTLPMLVFRIAGNRLSWDIGAVVPLTIGSIGLKSPMSGDTIIPLPILSLTYRIN